MVAMCAAMVALGANFGSNPTVAKANDGCSITTRSKRAVKVYGSSAYPTVCRATCHTPGANASKSTVNMNTMQWTLHWVYTIDDGSPAPSNLCPAEVTDGGSSGWAVPD
jgi:hypothetical protein